ncbi:hypothetical protein J4461_01940 [Candidatus Pacearchaeota archaeon]|nr:hypothetical protein [Candidatus Pacearchaeota archaeon]
MNKKGQISPKVVMTLVGGIVGWLIVGQINPEFSIIGGIIGAIIAYRFL